MWKAIVAGTATLAIAGTSLVYAQQRSDRDGAQRWRPNTEDMRAFGEARLAALKAGLTLTPDQEKNWPAFEQAARDFGKLRMDRRTAMRNTPPSDDPVERLRQRATAMTDTAAALKKLADATDPLYRVSTRIRSGVLRFSTAWAEPIGMGSADVMAAAVTAMVCAITGVRAAPILAQRIWNGLADSACSYHIHSLAPAVALPAPRHDRRRTGAAGSPPGGFPFCVPLLVRS